jgi:hypothetical protein
LFQFVFYHEVASIARGAIEILRILHLFALSIAQNKLSFTAAKLSLCNTTVYSAITFIAFTALSTTEFLLFSQIVIYDHPPHTEQVM